MKVFSRLHMLGVFLVALLLASCGTPPSKRSAIIPTPGLPAEVTINKEAGHGGHIIITLRLEDGQELPFIVDTGAPGIAIDKSLESTLGNRLDTTTLVLPQDKQKSGIYAAPKLFLGSTPLMTGSNVFTYDFKPRASHSAHPNMGFLGMECLKHYCIQLDFEAGKMRFLKPEEVNAAELGKAFPLTITNNRVFIHHSGFIGAGTNWTIDTGCNLDGLVGKDSIKAHDSGSDKESPAERDSNKIEGVYLPECIWENESYTNLNFAEYADVLGLNFLARHLVTLDFPGNTMYLKRTSVGPLSDAQPESGRRSTLDFLMRLRVQGELPGWAKEDQEPIYYGSDSKSGSRIMLYRFWKNGSSTTYHYTVARAAESNPPKLQKAWRTDRDGRTVEEYRVP